MRIHPFYKSLSQHNGVDFTVPEGSRIFATADGTVTEATRRSSTSGLTVTIDHGNGYQTRYGHLSEISVKKGQKVNRGDIIALSGNSGLSLAPHLHYEVIRDGKPVDPIDYFFLEPPQGVPQPAEHRTKRHAIVRLTPPYPFRHLTHPGGGLPYGKHVVGPGFRPRGCRNRSLSRYSSTGATIDYRFPKTKPDIVAMTITSATYTIVFFVPNTPRITNIFGRDNDGPASSKAKAGPLPIPDANNP